ncbi:hypothetical protein DV532_28590 (plasmid) [Pseudomonas sp. Leaf58]|uniref:hypothetical protein n=1 Tax=Pseudomonas sp. Leaf58 TaxID=1736226 RepID=UPI00070218EF|nr:hypothetical protein [Pseudomonas sp. Leaf58]AYG48227.1 hypothetical protein DV532_28590 [Pseudomonas sp. Leaf58]KQN62225.1 hypothetical protein ASF02_08665 [Pseudomonas sp. Leaf58]
MKSIGTYILDGKTPVGCEDYLQWSIWLGTADRTVALTRVANVKISTVCIGVDLNPENIPPQVFETMLTLVGGDELPATVQNATRQFANRGRRSGTWDEAQQVHDEYVALVKEAVAAAKTSISRQAVNDSTNDPQL